MVGKLIFVVTAAAAAIALFAGPAQAVGWWQYDTPQQCERNRQWFIDQGARVSGCESVPNGNDGVAYGFHIYS